MDILTEFNRTDIYIFVNDEEEAESYRKENPGVNIIATGKKGITPTRNYILDFFEDGEEIVMLDDDVMRFRILKVIDFRKHLFEIENIKEFFEQAFVMTRRANAKLWGVQACDVGVYMTRKINTDKFIIGTASGIINDHLRFDEDLVLKEDYDYTLKHIIEHGRVFKFNFISVEAKHYSNKGGCVDYRKKETEAEACKILLERYPQFLIPNVKRENEIIIK